MHGYLVRGAEGQHTRRPDVVLFVNGLPLAVLELKNSADEQATIWNAFNQWTSRCAGMGSCSQSRW